ncbi:hypothetical protein BK004_03160 [bacterium CG10_46_32]|nr:MAG: hypothetical protein BK004_03160 [bacterium CG10_46_32]PIR55997.1 MAG: DUF378 domain-containing protein [Parcubacteria group bacterium CG10_big_fil_rev_8_21_14_0_10_46_32]
MKALHMIAILLVIVGALNWGVLALTGWEVGQLFGGMEATVSKVIYILVGISGLLLLFTHKGDCKQCS